MKKPKLMIAAAVLLVAAASAAGTRPVLGKAGSGESGAVVVLKKGS